MLDRPQAGEFAEYYGRYIARVPGGNILDIIEKQIDETVRFLGTIDENKAAHRYAPGKWSLKGVVGHVIDVERLFQYRAMVFARNDSTPQPSMEPDDWARGANFDERTLADLTAEYRIVRDSGLALFRTFDREIAMRRGVASQREFTVRAIPYILTGHNIHHFSVIKERYL
jgi:hypothetical protein